MLTALESGASGPLTPPHRNGTPTMAVDLSAALKPILERLQALATTDAELRAQLRQLGQTLLAFADNPSTCESTTDLPPAVEQRRSPTTPPLVVVPQPAAYPFREAASEKRRVVSVRLSRSADQAAQRGV